MKNLFTSLDELIWNQFEKITQKANKELGWTKYDLAQKVDTISAACYSGCGIYGLIADFLKEKTPLSYTFDIACIILGPYFHKIKTEHNKKDEKKEIQRLINTNAPYEPTFNAFRSITLLIGLTWLGCSIYSFHESQTDIDTALSLSGEMASTYFSLNTISDYFRSQIFTPPSKKKDFWKNIYQKLTRQKPANILVPEGKFNIQTTKKYITVSDYSSPTTNS